MTLRSSLKARGVLLALLVAGLVTLPIQAFDLDELTDQIEKTTREVKKQVDKYEEANREISVREEIKIGENLTAGLLGAAPLVKDRKIQRYVNDVGFWVAAQTRQPA